MTGVRIDAVTVTFGGLTAVDGVTLDAPEGKLTGLIGPNGAGKSTIFNTCSGLIPPTRGTVSLFGEDVTRYTPDRRARLGLGRTFQHLELFDTLTVRENVRLGRESQLAGSRLLHQLFARRAERDAVAAAAAEALELCGIEHLADRPAGDLSTGQRRLVELARALAGSFRILLLDEPSSGLDGKETQEFGGIVRRAVTDGGKGILLVEHDMALVLRVCDYIYVLDFGKLIFAGTPDEVRASETVRAAYLGTAVP